MKKLSRRSFLTASLAAAAAQGLTAGKTAGKTVRHLPEASRPGILDRVSLPDPESAARHQTVGGDRRLTRFRWSFGDRDVALAGRTVRCSGAPLNFVLRCPPRSRLLTLELREFRTVTDSPAAYLVEVNGRPTAFRNRRYWGTGPTSAFIDIPDPAAGDQAVHIRLSNLCPDPISFSEAVLYSDLESFAQAEDLVSPLYVGPTTGVSRDRLTEIRGLLPDTPQIRPMFVLPTFAIAQWPAETTAQNLDEVIRVARDVGMPVELQLNTWWAGTPSGCDGNGGRWYDPLYQQVTYSPATGSFGLSVPNHWSSTPWLTTRNDHFNRFKAGTLQVFGQLLRERAAASADPLPILSLVVDNEVTYWGAGNPDTPPDLEADFNPAVVQAARRLGIVLDPRDGLSSAEIRFLRQSLRAYDRAMIEGLRAGLGGGPLADRVYTHTFMRGWCFDNPIQATQVGVLRNARMGGEWEAMSGSSIPLLEQHRELGIPAGINDERSNHGGAAPDVQFAYATGCDHLSLFNISDEGLREIKQSIEAGWEEFRVPPWRPAVLDQSFKKDTDWQKHAIDVGQVKTGVIWPGPTRALYGKKLDESNRALFRISSEAVGRPVFGPLVLSYEARAFFNGQKNASASIVTKIGKSRSALEQVDLVHDFNGRRELDVSHIASGASDLYIEFDFHPIGLVDWVCLYGFRLESPWSEEPLLYTNRSYRADRLRCESSIAAWRAEAVWNLQRIATELSRATLNAERKNIAIARSLLASGHFRRASSTALDILRHHAPAPLSTWRPLPPDRVDEGEIRSAGAGYLSIDPYLEGCMGRRLPLAAGARIELEENGQLRTLDSARLLLPGDDVSATVTAGAVTAVMARRGSVTGTVRATTDTTPFALPTLAVGDEPARPISSVASVVSRSGPEKGSCWLKVGPLPFALGDEVAIRWNPHTGRIVEIRPAG